MRTPWSALVLVAVTAGCCDLPFHPASLPADAPAVGGLDPATPGVRTVIVELLGPDDPVDGIPVDVFWEDSTGLPEGSKRLVAVGLRSLEGRVEARVPDRTIHIAAGGGDLWTEEWIHEAVPVGSEDARVVVRVYPLTVRGNFTGTWEPAAASAYKESGAGTIAWIPQAIPVEASPESQAGYAQRLRGLRANVSWTNELPNVADLGVAAWTSDGEDGAHCSFKDEVDDATLGPRAESYDSAVDLVGVDCSRYETLGNDTATILLGPATGRPALMPLGLEYRVEYAMDFGYRVGIEDLCELLDADVTVQEGADNDTRPTPDVVVAYVDPVNGTVGPDQDPNGRTVSEVPGVALPALVTLLASVLAFTRRRR